MKNHFSTIVRCLAPRAGSVKRLIGVILFFQFAAFPLRAATFSDLYDAGVQALQAGQYAKARDLLARAIELNPDQPGAWLDLAIAARSEGDFAFADDVLQIMESRFGVPAHLAALVDRLKSDLRRSIDRAGHAGNRWGIRSKLSTSVGVDTNANGGLSITELALTFPEGVFVLPISSDLRKRSDQFLTLGYAVTAQRDFGFGTVEPFFRSRLRQNFAVSDFDTQELALGLGWRLPKSQADAPEHLILSSTRLSLASQTIRLGNRSLLDSHQVTAEHQWAGSKCAPAVGTSVDDRHFPVQITLDSRLWSISSKLTCDVAYRGLPGRLQGQVRLGSERARQTFDALNGQGRVGGDTRHSELSILYIQKLPAIAWGGRFEAEAVYTRARDSDGYSVLLENNDRRYIHRSVVSLAYSLPLGPFFMAPRVEETEVSVMWQAFRQRSNLEIFRTDGQQIALGLTAYW